MRNIHVCSWPSQSTDKFTAPQDNRYYSVVHSTCISSITARCGHQNIQRISTIFNGAPKSPRSADPYQRRIRIRSPALETRNVIVHVSHEKKICNKNTSEFFFGLCFTGWILSFHEMCQDLAISFASCHLLFFGL
jgi:hypothetical protein